MTEPCAVPDSDTEAADRMQRRRSDKSQKGQLAIAANNSGARMAVNGAAEAVQPQKDAGKSILFDRSIIGTPQEAVDFITNILLERYLQVL